LQAAFGLQALSAYSLSDAIAPFWRLGPIFHSVKLVGPVVGLLTALTAPLLWSLCFETLWSRDFAGLILNDDPSWMHDWYASLLLPVGLPVGFVSGIALSALLQPVIVGKPTVPWTRGPFPVSLAAVGLGSLVYFYFYRTPDKHMWWQVFFCISRLRPLLHH
jgi:hypothetical protein